MPVRASVVTALGLGLALAVKKFALIPVDAVLYVAIAAIGASLAAALSGAFRLTARGAPVRWFALGVIGGVAGIALI